jgi:hypothetical protein
MPPADEFFTTVLPDKCYDHAMNDQSIFQAVATLLIQAYGPDAVGEVVLRLADARLAADAELEAAWFAVLDALSEMQEPGTGGGLH